MMVMPNIGYEFFNKAADILSSGQSRSIMLTGNVFDLFYIQAENKYVPLIEFLCKNREQEGKIIIVYELNSPLMFLKENDKDKMKDVWLKYSMGIDADSLAIKMVAESAKTEKLIESQGKLFESALKDAHGNSMIALELLRQFCLCSRSRVNGKPLMKENLLIIINGVDMMVPSGEISRMSEGDRRRITIVQDWLSDPEFMNGKDSVIMVAESKSMVNRVVTGLPHVLEVEVPSPNEEARKHFITWFNSQQTADRKAQLWGTEDELAKFTAALSIHALRQMLIGACYEKRVLSMKDSVLKVEEFIKSQLSVGGDENVVEFKVVSHGKDDVIGFSKLKRFIGDELIPRFKSTGADALSGAAVCGPLGAGKTFIFEWVAKELDMVVLVLKNLRSMWFGQTDVIFERLRRVLQALSKVLIFVDEADTAFGGVSAETHETERRLTGKIQAMMSDTSLKGKVIWLLMTARIHLLSPDIRRPGRVGDLIIPVFDPEGEDRKDFLKWVLKPVLPEYSEADISVLDEITKAYSTASFASLKAELIAKARGGKLDIARIKEIVSDHIPPAIGETRRYQTLQAMINCTRRSLLPDPNVTEDERKLWEAEIRLLEAKGVR